MNSFKIIKQNMIQRKLNRTEFGNQCFYHFSSFSYTYVTQRAIQEIKHSVDVTNPVKYNPPPIKHNHKISSQYELYTNHATINILLCNCINYC